MAKPILYGPRISTYVRTVRLVLAEKDVAYNIVEIDIGAGDHKEPTHLAHQPFGKVPAFEHEGFMLHETCAITRYIDEAFQGPRLQPGDPRGRALVVQFISIIDSYAYQPIIQEIVIPRFRAARTGKKPDEKAIEAAIPAASKALAAMEALFVGEFLAGKSLSLADLHFVPICDYFRQTPEGESLFSSVPKLNRWWSTMSRRPSLTSTAPS